VLVAQHINGVDGCGAKTNDCDNDEDACADYDYDNHDDDDCAEDDCADDYDCRTVDLFSYV
jgi:hypothetical protein